ncbi:DNA/pantothenate metabolism flavoprotein [uncultured Roseburia sp.]|uniref:Coenzyme A biosynthesis bifunctional protein CoaBC n=1 Tax=Brotonthovivens ammoniilytica TaxID=2981725 RepID=A0ABT2TH29_9FIRM|nr:bifunctional phosphopantothenoylcysteine decarboxylase/phosphopantothenate--cysteine ligase CoaBC [Brotonthovivens ammoniilytica]MCU6761500.1 bifunctional phosphopantothenoylcysteine decarboxylase/phosphopantothenate--cysteine ligase CoaBC [Brotonthovivens ammoniilytica]SCI30231.1 DNA/pantothenate metabolism flavoprotein [uncultured Roseburia sp.]
MLKGKTVVIGVTGGVAAYKMPNLASMLVKMHAEVHVIMTKNAVNFINPIAFESLTNTKCLVDTFDRNFQFHVAHVSLAKKADVMLIAPATANVIGKLAHGIADDMLTTTAMACKAPMLIAPAMNTNMYENPILQDNLKILKSYGKKIIEPASGMLACQDVGKGKMPEPSELLWHILKEIACTKDLTGKKVLVSAGPTREAIDPVRYITNHSTGKMGYAIAENAMLRGADVTLVTGPCSIAPPPFVEVVPVVTAQEMFDAVTGRAKEQDILILTAAVADYRPAETADEKIKKKDGDMSIALTRTKDIIGTLGEHKSHRQFLCGFSMETQNMLENSRKKLKKKHLDMIVANNLKVEGAGFGTDTNVVTLITNDEVKELPIMSKKEAAKAILDYILGNLQSFPV